MKLPEIPTWVPVAYGVVTALLGFAVLVWPKATVTVVVVVVAIQLIISALYQLFWAFSPNPTGTERAVLAISGTLALLVALLLLRKPLQTVAIVTMLVGLWWIVRGILDLFQVMMGQTALRGWSFLVGLLTLVAGVVVLLNPAMALWVLVLIGIWMIVSGLVIASTPLLMRRRT
jgi:uncharacterized membrane protein HdeD (DUF308 family)